jgi:L,D-transpeptidase ErfK/SrfK
VGQLEYVLSEHKDTLIDIGRRYGLGYDEIVNANRTVDRWVPGRGTKVILPRRFILPKSPRQGIVLNVSEARLYYFPENEQSRTVITYPVSIGRMDWKTPLGRTKVQQKLVDPPWRPTASIREEHAREGEILPAVIPGGDPENPLGRFALRLAIPGYLIHGVDARKAWGIGMRVTHGCIRMYPEDIEELYGIVKVGTPVTLVDQPIKAGFQGSRLYLEVTAPLEEDERSHPITYNDAIDVLREAVGSLVVELDERSVHHAVEKKNGVPTLVALTVSDLPPPSVREER